MTFFLSLKAWAEFIVSPGVNFTLPYKVSEMSNSGKSLVQSKQALGMGLEIELPLYSILSLHAGLNFRGSEAMAQYSYTNKSNPLDTAEVEDLKTNMGVFAGQLGARLRFFKINRVKGLIGGGYTRGVLYLSYEKDKFILANGSITGFKRSEDRPFEGIYLEAGLELQLSEVGSIMLLGRSSRQRTDEFETLGDSRISFKTSQLSLQYLHYLD